jgi:hypothetical protein
MVSYLSVSNYIHVPIGFSKEDTRGMLGPKGRSHRKMQKIAE